MATPTPDDLTWPEVYASVLGPYSYNFDSPNCRGINHNVDPVSLVATLNSAYVRPNVNSHAHDHLVHHGLNSAANRG